MEKLLIFRAEDVKNKTLVYGYPFPVVINNNKRWFIIPCDTYCPKDITIKESQVEVVPESIEMATYQDEYGNIFFEGDIFEHDYYEDCKVRLYYDEEVLAVVGQVFDENGEYEKITIIPSDFKKMKKVLV